MLPPKTLACLPRAGAHPPIGSENLPLEDLNLAPGDLLLVQEEDENSPTPCVVAWTAPGLIWALFHNEPVAFPATMSAKENGIVEVLRPAVSGPVAQVLVLAKEDF